MSKARHFDQNSPLIHGLIEKLATFAVGTGIVPVAASGSARWNKSVSRMWEAWARRPELTDRFSWGTVQRILVRSALRDGDSFALLTSRDDGSPALQLIEAHRIGDDALKPGASNDGVIRNEVGKHVGYRLLKEDGTLDHPLDGDSVAQFLLVERPDQPRGMSVFASALTTVHDLSDVLKLEQLAVKDASSHTNIVKTASGELPMEEVARLDADDVPPIGQDATGYYHTVFGPEAKVLQHGDDWTAYEPKRPSPAWQGFVQFLAESIVLSTGLPPSVLLPGKVGGADTRKDLASAARTLEVWQWAIADSLQKVYEYVIQAWIDRREIGNAPKDWQRVNWQMPRSISCDAGRDAKADLDMVASGLLTLEDFYGQQGYDGRQKLQQLANEQELVNELDPSGMLATRLYSRPGTAQAAPDPEAESEGPRTATDDEEEEPEEGEGEETAE